MSSLFPSAACERGQIYSHTLNFPLFPGESLLWPGRVWTRAILTTQWTRDWLIMSTTCGNQMQWFIFLPEGAVILEAEVEFNWLYILQYMINLKCVENTKECATHTNMTFNSCVYSLLVYHIMRSYSKWTLRITYENCMKSNVRQSKNNLWGLSAVVLGLTKSRCRYCLLSCSYSIWCC